MRERLLHEGASDPGEAVDASVRLVARSSGRQRRRTSRKDVAQLAVTSVNIRPDVTILSVLQHLNYRPWFALAEFVDNALESFLENRKELGCRRAAANPR